VAEERIFFILLLLIIPLLSFVQMVSSVANIHVGAVDCEAEVSLCRQQGVQSYPTIRLYPLGGHGLSTIA
jgi:hypothetical protein